MEAYGARSQVHPEVMKLCSFAGAKNMVAAGAEAAYKEPFAWIT